MIWRQTLHLRQFLDDDTSGEGVKRAATGIIGVLGDHHSQSIKFKKALDFVETDAEVALLVFNDAMNQLYDWADNEKVWIA